MTESVVLVTGAAQSIGRGIVEKLRTEGWQVAALDCHLQAIERAQRGWASEDKGIHWIQADVAQEKEVLAAVGTVQDRWGRLDGVVNNAAISTAHSDPAEDLSLKHWQRVLDANLTGPFLVSRSCLSLLRKSRGAIVNIASTRALQSEPHCEAYGASKGGLVSLTHAMAASLSGQVRVNAISPGWIDTGPWQNNPEPQNDDPADHAWHWAGRVGLPEDVAAMVHYLLSPAAAFISGQNFIIDGGATRKMVYPPL
ncbi:SDR family oxidoreductase [Desulfurispira natronophila]|uniref:NAD(P)-dependent dehydrogenase (Short-subunit alcohol dehydrogenase family) n=1 Tax=Desulfurispira natronophila TaxID=682562 RepID=A0A7W8DH45_9BACT|nr:SDR family oxidoreductase [Desulfurispira natronophila]MBB5022125.1 NAD(P)-dependent dehydrogenase (short-subunit alcohol dehydrogenase family) [Desulfurispira natronophila]